MQSVSFLKFWILVKRKPYAKRNMIAWKILWIFLVIFKLIILVHSDGFIDFADLILNSARGIIDENNEYYIQLLNERNLKAKKLGKPLRETKSGPAKSNRPVFVYMAPSSHCIPFDNPELKEYLDLELKKIKERIDVQIEKKLKTDISDGVICEDKGRSYFAPVPENCSAYYICAFGKPHLNTCANGLQFCSSSLECVLKESAKCLESSPIVCRQNEIYYMENPIEKKTDCTNYILCSNGISIPKICSKGTIFNPSIGKCVLEKAYNCPHGGTNNPKAMRHTVLVYTRGQNSMIN